MLIRPCPRRPGRGVGRRHRREHRRHAASFLRRTGSCRPRSGSGTPRPRASELRCGRASALVGDENQAQTTSADEAEVRTRPRSRSKSRAFARLSSRLRAVVGRGLDVRPLVDASDVGEYAAGRILASYDDVEKFVAPCTDLRRDSALDVGCGAGLETFALGSHFERVVGVDPDAKAIAAAQRLAGRAGTDRVDFRPTTIEAFETRDKYSFVLCNVMSHNLPSRRVLLARLRRLARPGAWLAYAEQTEGYPLLEIANALQARN